MMWDAVVPEMHALGVLTGVDVGVITAMCCHWGDGVEATIRLATEGLLDAAGRRNPAWQVKRDSFAAYIRYCSEIGLTPAARTRYR